MLPCSMRQIVETGHLRQQSLLAEANRDRRAAHVAATAERSIFSWGRLTTILGAIAQFRLF